MTPADVSDAVVAAVRAVAADGRLGVPVPEKARLTSLDAGTYGTPIALSLAGHLKTPKAPRELAEAIAANITREGLKAEATGDGFLTLRLDTPGSLATGILAQGRNYGAATPQEAAGTPREAAASPSEPAGTPPKAAALPLEAAGAPPKAVALPLEAAGTPSRAATSPLEAAALPLRGAALPLEAVALALEGAASPPKAAGTPLETAGAPPEAAGPPLEVAGTPLKAAGAPREAAGPPVEAAGMLLEVAAVSPERQPPWPDRPRDFTNKGFVVRFAYERAAATQRRAKDLEVHPGDPAILDHPYERTLLKELADLPARAEQATRENDPRPLKRNLERIAEAFHQVYEQCPALPKGDERPGAMHGARRTLAEATRIALENGMHMIGEIPRERI